MQILLKALIAESGEDKRPSTAISGVEGGDAKILFSELFTSGGGEFGEDIDKDVLPFPTLEYADSRPQVEVILPKPGRSDWLDARQSSKPMIDITPGKPASLPEPPEARSSDTIVPVARPLEPILASALGILTEPTSEKTPIDIQLPQRNLPEAAHPVVEATETGSRDETNLDQPTSSKQQVHFDKGLQQASRSVERIVRHSRLPLPELVQASQIPIDMPHRDPDVPAPAEQGSVVRSIGLGPDQVRTPKVVQAAPVHSGEDMRHNTLLLVGSNPAPLSAVEEARTSTSNPSTQGMFTQSAAGSTQVQPLANFEKIAGKERTIDTETVTVVTARESEEARQPTPTTSRQEPAARTVVTQVIQAVMRANLDGMIEVRLHPEELGRVRLAMTHLDAGVVVHITAERPETLDLLRRNIDMLESDLRGQGFENPSFSFGRDGSDSQHKGDDAPDSIKMREQSELPQIQVDITSQPHRLDDRRLDIRL